MIPGLRRFSQKQFSDHILKISRDRNGDILITEKIFVLTVSYTVRNVTGRMWRASLITTQCHRRWSFKETAVSTCLASLIITADVVKCQKHRIMIQT